MLVLALIVGGAVADVLAVRRFERWLETKRARS